MFIYIYRTARVVIEETLGFYGLFHGAAIFRHPRYHDRLKPFGLGRGRRGFSSLLLGLLLLFRRLLLRCVRLSLDLLHLRLRLSIRLLLCLLGLLHSRLLLCDSLSSSLGNGLLLGSLGLLHGHLLLSSRLLHGLLFCLLGMLLLLFSLRLDCLRFPLLRGRLLAVPSCLLIGSLLFLGSLLLGLLLDLPRLRFGLRDSFLLGLLCLTSLLCLFLGSLLLHLLLGLLGLLLSLLHH